MGESYSVKYSASGNSEKLPYSECLNESELELIRDNSNSVKYNKKEIIFRQNIRTSHIMFIKSGLVKIYKEGRNNKFIILKLAKEGDYLGLMSIFGSDIHQYSASAVDVCDIVYIDINVFKEVMANNGLFTSKLVKMLSEYGLYIFEKLISISHKQLPGRIADVILYFSEFIYKNATFEFPLTRKELAELAGTTKESFIRTLTEFKNDKIIELDGSKVHIVSMKIIKTLSDLG